MKLYTFFRSGTSHRLRIALNLKGLAYEQVAVDLRREQHLGADFKVNNRRILEALRHRFGADEAAVNEWCAGWITPGFDAFAALLERHGRDQGLTPSASGSPLPTCTWCRRSKARGASRWTFRTGRACSPSTRLAPAWRFFVALHRLRNPMPGEPP